VIHNYVTVKILSVCAVIYNVQHSDSYGGLRHLYTAKLRLLCVCSEFYVKTRCHIKAYLEYDGSDLAWSYQTLEHITFVQSLASLH